MLTSRSRTRTTCRTCRRSRSQQYDLVIGVGFLMAEAVETVAKQFPDTNFAIIDFSQAALKGKPDERARACCSRRTRPATSSATWPALIRQGQGRRPGDLLGRRPEDPAGRRLHRRLPGRRQGGEPGHQDAQRLLAGLRRPGEVQGDRAQPDRARARRSSSRSPASAASARSTPPRRRACWGIGVDADQALPRRAHPDHGAEEGRRGRVRRPSRRSRTARSRAARTTIFDLEERRRRARQDATPTAAEVRRRRSRRSQRADQGRRDRPTSRPEVK